MAYTPINWDENTPITPTNLDNMDSQIDDNEDDLRKIQGEEVSVDGRITTNEGDITDLLNFQSNVQWNSGRYAGNHSTGDPSREISVGFTPDIVIISVSDASDYYGLFDSDVDDGRSGFLVTDSHSAGWSDDPVRIINNGFSLGEGAFHNRDGKYYQWVALKLG